jgi:hypothetical protein
LEKEDCWRNAAANIAQIRGKPEVTEVTVSLDHFGALRKTGRLCKEGEKPRVSL